MTVQELILLREKEDRVEFKEAKTNFSFAGGEHSDPAKRRKCILGYVVALANEGGGRLIFGITDSYPHQVVGTSFAENETGHLENEIYKRLKIRVKIDQLLDDINRVLVFNIPSRPPGGLLKFEGVPLMRTGDSLRVMSDDEVYRILSEREPDFSAQVCEEMDWNDLDPKAIELLRYHYARKQNNTSFNSLPDRQILSDLELYQNGKFNYATLLLVGSKEAIRKYLPHAQITIEYRSNASLIPYTAREEFQEPIFTALNKIWDYLNQPASNPMLHIRQGPYIFDIPSFNEEVIREATLNAVTHRSYRIQSDTLIKQYPDKIVITSAGGFPPGVTEENMLIVNSTPRNRRLAEVLQKTGLVERSGQGIDKMFYWCLMESKPLPDYSHTDRYQVELRFEAKIMDNAFYVFINEINKNYDLNVFDLIVLDKIRQGASTELDEEVIEKIKNLGLISSQSPADKKYVLCDQYYDIAKQTAYIGGFRTRDLKIISECFDNKEEVFMKDFMNAFDSLLNRDQVRYIISKLEKKKLLLVTKAQKFTRYSLNKEMFNQDISMYAQLVQLVSE